MNYWHRKPHPKSFTVHAVPTNPGREGRALCGAVQHHQHAAWQPPTDAPVNCSRCLKILETRG